MPAFLDRYLTGDRIGVWNELVALGEAVRLRKATATTDPLEDPRIFYPPQ